jgi:hypothetical protein
MNAITTTLKKQIKLLAISADNRELNIHKLINYKAELAALRPYGGSISIYYALAYKMCLGLFIIENGRTMVRPIRPVRRAINSRLRSA